MDTNTIVKRFFWGAFAAFLLASIPHVAYFFRAYEPVAQGADDIWEWVVSYGIAASIDITIFLLSVTVSGLQRRNARKSLIFSVWIFIFALAVLSWYINDRYALHFMNTTMMSATAVTVHLFILNTTIADINPLIASCFQILAIAYTWISDKLTNNEAPPTALELEQIANELAAAKIQKERIKEINRGKVSSAAIDAFDSGFDVVGHVANKFKSAAKEVKNEEDNVPEIEEELPEYEDDIPDDNTPINEPEQQTYTPLRRDDLGMIEGIMYDKVMEDETVLLELLNEANMSSISELTLSLQRRFSSHANYITESRVRNVFEAIKGDHPRVISAPNEQDMEPDTDPEMETILPDDNDAPEPANITNISSVKKPRITQDLNPDMQSKRGAYAITKQAAAELLRCPISEIERGIMAGEIKPFAKDMDKVLRTSLDGFVPQKRSRKAAKVAAK
jgi:hypothetical protein